jgi:putative ABC transport system permease protein
MMRVALRNLWQHKLRTSLTILAVLLGVAMISGTYVLTDQLRSGFEDIYQSAYKNIDVVVAPKPAFGESFEAGMETLPDSLVAKVEAVEGVKTVNPSLSALGVLVIDGEALQTMGSPTLFFNAAPTELDSVTYYAGSKPAQSGEIAVNRDAAEANDLSVGDEVAVGTQNGAVPVRISGLFDFGSEGASLGGSILVVGTTEDLRDWFDLQGVVSAIEVKGEGTDADALAARIRAAIDYPQATVKTGAVSAAEQTQAVGDALDSVLTPALLAFGGVAVLVGAFIIFNTFSITVAQRQREFAMLRTLGATRRQVLGTVVAEALVIGVGASVAGLFAGLGVAMGMNSLFKAVGADIPVGGLEMAPRTIIIGLAVGIGITLISALVPAIRATRVPPVAALQEGAALPPSALSRYVPYFGGLLAASGIGLLVLGLLSEGSVTDRLLQMAIGGVLIFFAVATVAKYVVRPTARVLGWPVDRVDGSAGRLARENSMRNPARTAATAAALMIGLAVVVFVAVFTAGFKSSFVDAVDEMAKGDLIVRTQSGGMMTALPESAGEAIRRVPTVESVSGIAFQQVQVEGGATGTIIGIEPSDMKRQWEYRWLDGGSDALLDELGPDTAVVEEQFALDHKLAVGDTVTVLARSGETADFEIVGTYRDPNLFAGLTVSNAGWDRLFAQRDAVFYLLSVEPGASVAATQKGVDAAMESYPQAIVETKAEYIDSIVKQLNQFLYMLYALLAVSVIISLFGIVNTLILTVYERTREIGMLRAIGASRSQIRRMIRYESVITAIMGGVLGIVLGTAFAYIVTTQLGAQGISFTVPPVQLVICLIVAIVVGVLAAVLPARRAARTDILAAIHYE